ncbi:hypothetical protein DFP94_11746 [Fontibacillus phaseoli]|uniref:Uncharacterized protein n=1 Tax=Fontibacillus phaseoli TaxID=1416533 RepID=A0A369B1I8_9BACL|nr:hypothetical protein DFP94_11746 [Fontibacillus phaseoli]
MKFIRVHHGDRLSGEDLERILEHLEAELEQINDRDSEG